MVQFRRLDPLANAGPYQRLQKMPVKSFSLTESQYNRVGDRRPGLIVTEGESAVIGLPTLDTLEIHYAFADRENFHDRFGELFNQVVAASSVAEAPRGIVLPFRDRPNRSVANTVFWGLLMAEGREWVEMSRVAIPELDAPVDSFGDGYRVSTDEPDLATISQIEAAASGREPLSRDAVELLRDDSRWLRVVEDASGAPVAFLALRTEPGGWGVIDHVIIRPEHAEALRQPLLEWTTAFLRNNGGRRIRQLVHLDETVTLNLLRDAGFTAGETGIDYTRTIDQTEVKSMLDERKSHGTVVKFGWWR
jgi:hypothetical protein